MKGTVNVSDYHGDMIATYKGEIENLNWNGNGVVSFLYNGKQVVICNGIIVIEEA